MDQKKITEMLSGVRVLDISTVIAGPGTAAILADYGADVIKIEHPKTGDTLRTWGSKKNGIPLGWKWLSRNKRLLAVDLSAKDGQSIVTKLASQADILIENYRPGKLEEWNLGYDILSAKNPKLIMLRITGWGQNGPYKQQPGFGTLAEAFSGFCHITGAADGPPTLPGFPLADGLTAVIGTYAVLMALYHRQAHDAPGQVIDLSLFESLFSLLGPQVTEYDQLGIVQKRFGNRSPRGVPRNAYQTQDGSWVAISAFASDMALRLFRAIGKGEMAEDPRYNNNENRLKHGDVVDGIVADWIKQRPLTEVLDTLQKAEVPVAPVYDIAQIMRDPQYLAREVFVQLQDDDLGPMKMANMPVKFSQTPGKIRYAGRAAIGQDTVEILHEIGLNDEQIEDLSNRKIIRKADRKAMVAAKS
jgi:crotonobetainyl-CoA:carnitine CoA-transferase CaiB-like acyl-CoA transferase